MNFLPCSLIEIIYIITKDYYQVLKALNGVFRVNNITVVVEVIFLQYHIKKKEKDIECLRKN